MGRARVRERERDGERGTEREKEYEKERPLLCGASGKAFFPSKLYSIYNSMSCSKHGYKKASPGSA